MMVINLALPGVAGPAVWAANGLLIPVTAAGTNNTALVTTGLM
jgi:hypothetical protein